MRIRRQVWGSWIEIVDVPDDIDITNLEILDLDDWVTRTAHEEENTTCWETECPAGGAHQWGVLEQAGTGKTWAGCEECGAPDHTERR